MRHIVLRIIEGAVVDTPVPILHENARIWAATCWRDTHHPSSWPRALWWPSPYHRGWLPIAIEPGRLIEFRADIPAGRIRRRRHPVRCTASSFATRRPVLSSTVPTLAVAW